MHARNLTRGALEVRSPRCPAPDVPSAARPDVIGYGAGRDRHRHVVCDHEWKLLPDIARGHLRDIERHVHG